MTLQKRGRIHGFNGSSGLWLFAEMKAGIFFFTLLRCCTFDAALTCFQQKVQDSFWETDGGPQKVLASTKSIQLFFQMLWEKRKNASNTKIFSNNAFYVHELLYMLDL